MANEVVVINTVTKRENGGNFQYAFPIAVIDVFVADESYKIQLKTNYAEAINAKFDDVTDKLGKTTVESYVDEMAERGFFFDPNTLFLEQQIEDNEQFGPGKGNVKTDYESMSLALQTSQDDTLKKMLYYIKSIAE